jgi:hypothetical protein
MKIKGQVIFMIVKFLLNRIGYPLVAELAELNELPGPGEKITLNSDSKSVQYEVTEIKRDTEDDSIYIYVDTV